MNMYTFKVGGCLHPIKWAKYSMLCQASLHTGIFVVSFPLGIDSRCDYSQVRGSVCAVNCSELTTVIRFTLVVRYCPLWASYCKFKFSALQAVSCTVVPLTSTVGLFDIHVCHSDDTDGSLASGKIITQFKKQLKSCIQNLTSVKVCKWKRQKCTYSIKVFTMLPKWPLWLLYYNLYYLLNYCYWFSL